MGERVDPLPHRTRRLADMVGRVRLTTVWVVAAIAIPTAVATSIPLSAVDLTYQIRAGRFMLDAGHILREDVFTSSALGLPWLNQQWGAQIILGGLFEIGGWLALAALRVAVVALVTGMLYASCRNVGASRRWSAGLTISAGIMLAGGFLVRAQLFGIACFAATQWLLSRRDRHPAGVWWALPIAVVWANTHGSFFFAPILFAIAWAQDRQRSAPSSWRLVVVGLLTIPMTLLNPFGVRVWGYVVTIATDPGIKGGVLEWRPPTFETGLGVLFWVSVVAVALFIGSRWPNVTWPTLAGLGCFMVIGALSIRGSLWWALAAPVLVASTVSSGTPQRSRADPRGPVNAVLAGILCLIAIAPLIRWIPYSDDVVPESLITSAPAGITRTLEDLLEPGEEFFNAQEWGSWFEFALPSDPVFVDSRFELIPEEAWRDYEDVSAGREGWQAILDRHGFRVVVTARDQQESLLPVIQDDPDWELAYQDETGAVFVRSGTS